MEILNQQSWGTLLLACVIGLLIYSMEVDGEPVATYLGQRNQFLKSEIGEGVGAKLVLNEKEKRVDDILLAAKRKEVAQGFSETFPPTVNFLTGKPLVEKSAVFDIIKRMPKGGILHIHEISIADPWWVVQTITYLPHLYYCVSDDYFSSLRFKFAGTVPQEKPVACKTEWALVSESRAALGSSYFDQLLYHNLTMVTDQPDEVYPNTTMSWLRFQQALLSLTDLYFSVTSFDLFVKQSLLQMIQDNVQYVEIRTVLFPLQELDGTIHPPEYTLQQYIRIAEEFKQQYPNDFAGLKIISSSIRHPVNRPLIKAQVQLAMDLRKKYPNYFAGYDLVAQEDGGGPLVDYLNELLYPLEVGSDLPFFFHAGETNWQGTFVDDNLIDAVLLNTTRIGHGYAINKHPAVLEVVRSRGIAIELNPISNQVLHLVHDLRNHIGASLIAEDYPVVVSSDDPAAWGSLPLSHDYYMAFMAMSRETTGLTLLKQLALNTFKYSAMTASEKEAANDLWQAKWNIFLDETLAKYELTETMPKEEL
ncbi:adenosine deaminase AGSA [Strongylocentrotus purpuratus]|uniref:adenosine deaminase n=1 Tax=Strongylocentrotus purpuratus TaxID=7668 RepID=A0A7M7P2A7_STRPU|nr:adenosine deaminase AGSA [Strongylocentrotus purpuratus]